MMEGAAAAATPPFGAWASIRGYFTPATLFLVLNLVIGTIALTSRSHQRRRRREHHLHDYHQAPPPFDPHQQDEYHYYQYQQQQQPNHNQYATPPLARTSSVLDRLRSIGLYRFRSGDFPPEYAAGAVTSHHDAFSPVVEEEEAAKQYARSRSEPAPAREERRVKKPGTDVVRKSQAARPPATRVVEAVAAAEEYSVAALRQQEPASPPRAEYRYQYQDQQEEEAEYVPPPAPMRAPPPLSRTSSVLDRLRSIGLYSFLGADQPPAAPAPAEPDNAFVFPPAGPDNTKRPTPAHAPHYDRTRSEPAREQRREERTKQAPAAAAQPKKMAKSSSATRKPGAALAPQQSINTRADAFIDSFRREQSQKRLHHHHHHEDDYEDDEHHAVPPPPAPLARTSSVLDRLRSFGTYLRSGDAAAPEDPYDGSNKAAEEEKKQQYGRSRSEPAREQQGKARKKQEARMSKTSSEADMAEEAPAEQCVDARADDFINKFRQQLQLQRLNSLLNYKEVLNRKN